MANKNTGSVKARRKRRARIWQRWSELRDEPPTFRVRTMNEEFGPYWYYNLKLDQPIPQELRLTERYKQWVRTLDPNY